MVIKTKLIDSNHNATRERLYARTCLITLTKPGEPCTIFDTTRNETINTSPVISFTRADKLVIVKTPEEGTSYFVEV